MDPVTVAALGVLSAILAIAGFVARKAWPAVRKLNHFVDDVGGEPARAGVPARPGLMERMASLEGRLCNLEGDVLVVKDEVKNHHRTNLREDLDKVDTKVSALHKRWATTDPGGL